MKQLIYPPAHYRYPLCSEINLVKFNGANKSRPRHVIYLEVRVAYRESTSARRTSLCSVAEEERRGSRKEKHSFSRLFPENCSVSSAPVPLGAPRWVTILTESYNFGNVLQWAVMENAICSFFLIYFFYFNQNNWKGLQTNIFFLISWHIEG